MAICRSCGTHIGWRFESRSWNRSGGRGDAKLFWGLIWRHLRQHGTSIANQRVTSQQLWCPKEHPLQRYAAPHEHYVCDVCNRKVKPGEHLWGCGACDYDMCDGCKAKAVHTKPLVASRVATGSQATGRKECGNSSRHQVKCHHVRVRPLGVAHLAQAALPGGTMATFLCYVLALMRTDYERYSNEPLGNSLQPTLIQNMDRRADPKIATAENVSQIQGARRQLWPPLVEKAAAKLFGCYGALKGGTFAEALALFTGYPTQKLRLYIPKLQRAERAQRRQARQERRTQLLLSGREVPEEQSDDSDDDDLNWSKLVSCKDAGYLLGLGCSEEACEKSKHHIVEEMGLQAPHAYGILDLAEVTVNGKTEHLVKIRNPWGQNAPRTWKGRWGKDPLHGMLIQR
eukprot:symbB.v1.2.027155.t1/scaffold2767.1/size71155/4